ncbi:hypothetical protein DTL42_23660 [Bremerella cremea]|uniref:Uncharacterized protein n=1 Tax=Bremerella cremea TaxID=1031537 RepID=A0A368KLH7_9BACT|nr:helix-turn-helix domain-containing protein [Bremerella cremea]RCS41544.1 hypothetical protein DTL42_23660 [Bremerella cremea]
MRPHGSAAELEARQMKALDLIRQGWRVKDVAEALGVTATTVSTWKNKPGGKRSLKAKPQHVPLCRAGGTAAKETSRCAKVPLARVLGSRDVPN